MNEQLDKLRNWSRWFDSTYAFDSGGALEVFNYKPYDNRKSCGECFRLLADEIENDLSANYVRLPVDIDGVPWHIGDVVLGHGELKAMCLDQYGWHFQNNTAIKPDIHAHECRESIESVLCEMIHEYGSTDKLTETVAAEYADKIRDLLGARER